MVAGADNDRRILIVEDEAMVAMLLEDLVQDLGYATAGPAATVERALACLSAGGIAAAVLDVNLRGERSYPVADALAALGVPYLFVTGYGQAGLDPAYRDRPVLQKPLAPDDLGRALAGLWPAGPSLE